jgi:hypothetical protein
LDEAARRAARQGRSVRISSTDARALKASHKNCPLRPVAFGVSHLPNTDAFIEVDEVTQCEIKRILTGWMFASSPGLHAVEHPIYDVWLMDCKNPVVAAVPPPEAPRRIRSARASSSL